MQLLVRWLKTVGWLSGAAGLVALALWLLGAPRTDWRAQAALLPEGTKGVLFLQQLSSAARFVEGHPALEAQADPAALALDPFRPRTADGGMDRRIHPLQAWSELGFDPEGTSAVAPVVHDGQLVVAISVPFSDGPRLEQALGDTLSGHGLQRRTTDDGLQVAERPGDIHDPEDGPVQVAWRREGQFLRVAIAPKPRAEAGLRAWLSPAASTHSLAQQPDLLHAMRALGERWSAAGWLDLDLVPMRGLAPTPVAPPDGGAPPAAWVALAGGVEGDAVKVQLRSGRTIAGLETLFLEPHPPKGRVGGKVLGVLRTNIEPAGLLRALQAAPQTRALIGSTAVLLSFGGLSLDADVVGPLDGQLSAVLLQDVGDGEVDLALSAGWKSEEAGRAVLQKVATLMKGRLSMELEPAEQPFAWQRRGLWFGQHGQAGWLLLGPHAARLAADLPNPAAGAVDQLGPALRDAYRKGPSLFGHLDVRALSTLGKPLQASASGVGFEFDLRTLPVTAVDATGGLQGDLLSVDATLAFAPAPKP